MCDIFYKLCRLSRHGSLQRLNFLTNVDGMCIRAKRFNITKSAHCYSLVDQLQSQYAFNHRLKAIKTGGGPVVLC